MLINACNILTPNGADEARQATEPVFSFTNEVGSQSFRSVFRTNLDGQALFNAIMLTRAFAVNGCTINRECLEYQSRAIRSVREKIDFQDTATMESTLGVILLLVGIEVCKP